MVGRVQGRRVRDRRLGAVGGALLRHLRVDEIAARRQRWGGGGGRPHGRRVARRDRGVRGEGADGGCEAAGAGVAVPEFLGGLATRDPKYQWLAGEAVDGVV